MLQGSDVIASVQARMEALIATPTAQIAAVEAESVSVVDKDTDWADAIKRLPDISGVGPVTASWLVVSALNFTLCATDAKDSGR